MSLKESFLYTDLCKRLAIWPDAITPEQLLVELEKVKADGKHISEEHRLIQAFSWAFTPQGAQFWRDMDKKAYPLSDEE